MGDVSEHFSRSEFRCHGFGVPGHQDHDTPIDPDLLVLLEALRSAVGRPLRIISGHRCEWWNRRVDGAQISTHMYGEAADIPYRYIRGAVARQLGAIGLGVKNGWAVHVDTRSAPRARWRY